jgi:formamidopyrimidine-DNA glycosylase
MLIIPCGPPRRLLLMDQSVIAGVGNIYRAEILFKAGVHPEQRGNTLRWGGARLALSWAGCGQSSF